MIVIVLEKVSPSVRGELTRWLIEPHTGVFVGHVSAMVREKLWEKCRSSCREGGLIMLWTTNNEQHFDMAIWGNTKRKVLDFEGLKLVMKP